MPPGLCYWGGQLIPFTYQQLLAATGGHATGPMQSLVLQGVSTDTRSLKAGDLFVALQGPNHDGNLHAQSAVERGAGALLLRTGSEGWGELRSSKRGVTPGYHPGHSDSKASIPIVLCDSPRRALSDLAQWHRERLNIPVVGITGSCGKTSTKSILHSLLKPHRTVVASPASFNNDIGVPHTLFLTERETQALVVEMGTNAPGEIAALCRTAAPTGAIVTHVGASHLAGLGSEEGVAHEKSALPQAVPADGFVVLNADCPWSDLLRQKSRAKVWTFGRHSNADVYATDIVFKGRSTHFNLWAPAWGQQGSRPIELPMLGQHMVANYLAALCGALAMGGGWGLGIDELIGSAPCELSQEPGRMQWHALDGVTVIDDCYNANPDSALAAVRVLRELKGRRILIFGGMHELGRHSARKHEQLGEWIAQSGIDGLLTVGSQAARVAQAAHRGGMSGAKTATFDTIEELKQYAGDWVQEGDVVLVKGSRASALDGVVQHLVQVWGVSSPEVEAPHPKAALHSAAEHSVEFSPVKVSVGQLHIPSPQSGLLPNRVDFNKGYPC